MSGQSGHAHGHHHPVAEGPGTAILAVGAEARGLAEPNLPVAAPGRALQRAVLDAAEAGDGPVVVVPMSFGREPSLLADSARTLRESAAVLGPGRLCLAGPFGDATMLVSLLRGAVRRNPEANSVLVVSPSIDPFADAELYRIARLVRHYGSPELVEVAFDGGAEPDPDLALGLDRCRALGGGTPLVVPAYFGAAPAPGAGLPGEGERLIGGAALRSVIDTRVREALHRLAHGDDGIDSGTSAEDGHGYAHSHTAADGTVYTHSH